MVCGINFGYSAADEAQEAAGIEKEIDPKSFFSDTSVNNTRFRNTTLKWLKSWDLPFEQTTSPPTTFERSFFQTNWIDSQTRSVGSDGIINLETLVAQADGILGLVAARQPSVIIFLGSQLIKAFNDIRLRERVVTMLGKRSGNAQIHIANLDGYQGEKYKLLTQYFGQTLIIGMPHPQAQGISDAYVKALKPTLEFIRKIQAVGLIQ